MKKLEQYNVKFKRNLSNVDDIKLTQSLMWELLELYIGKEVDKKNQDIIVKYILPKEKKDEEVSALALEELKNGIEVNGKKYISFITSPGMMKKSVNRRKCEYLFIRENEEYKNFRNLYRDILSIGKVNSLYNQEKVCINKDIISRESLSLSGSYKINHNPYLLILPSQEYKHISNYITIDKETGELKEQLGEEKEFDAFDGCGLMSPKMADKIKKEINSEHDIDFAIIRNFPLAVKGLVVKCDFIKFYEDNYNKDNEWFKQVDGEFYAKDIYNCWIPLSKVDLIVTTNMAKWAKLWDRDKDNLSDTRNINDAIREVIDIKYKKYKSVLNNLFVTKVNKAALPEYTKISYQVLNNLALTTQELRDIQRKSIEYLEKVVNLEIDYVKMYLGDIASDIEQDEDGNILNDVTASTKAHRMLQASDSFINSKAIRGTISNNIKKSCHEVVCKPYVKGNFKYAIDDPICFLRWIMTRDIENSRELKAGQFYVPKEVGNVVMTRNPLAIANEVHKIELVKNEMLDKYFGNLTNEIIMFNTADNMGFISSGSDRDGDSHAIWYDEIIYNSVIEPDLHFNFVNDGDTYEVKWTPEDEYLCVLKASGNLIGSISNITTKLSNKAQQQGYIIDGEHFTVGEIAIEYLSDKPEIKSELENIKKRIKNIQENIDRLEEGNYMENEDLETLDNYKILKDRDKKRLKDKRNEILTIAVGEAIKNGAIQFDTLDTDTQKKYLRLGFKDYERDMLEALMWSQIAIDASKTCVVPNNDDMSRIIKYKSQKHPRFMYYAKYKSSELEVEWDDTKQTNSSLDITAKEIYNSLIKEAKNLKKGNDSMTAFKYIFTEVEENSQALEAINNFYKIHSNGWKEAKKIKNIEEKNSKIADYQLEVLTKIEELPYNHKEIAYALFNADKMTSEFIFTYCYLYLLEAIKDIQVYEYVEDPEGEFDWKFKRYRKELRNAGKDKLLRQQKDKLLKDIGTYSFNVSGLTGLESLIEYNAEILIKEELEGKYANLNVYVNNKKVGRIFRNSLKVNLVDGQVLVAKGYEYIGKKTNSIKVTVAV